MLVLAIVAVLLVRNVPRAVRPFLAPPQERNLAAAVVPIVTVILAIAVLVLAWKSPHRSLISWPK